MVWSLEVLSTPTHTHFLTRLKVLTYLMSHINYIETDLSLSGKGIWGRKKTLNILKARHNKTKLNKQGDSALKKEGIAYSFSLPARCAIENMTTTIPRVAT